MRINEILKPTNPNRLIKPVQPLNPSQARIRAIQQVVDRDVAQFQAELQRQRLQQQLERQRALQKRCLLSLKRKKR